MCNIVLFLSFKINSDPGKPGIRISFEKDRVEKRVRRKGASNET